LGDDRWEIAYRTWRAEFRLSPGRIEVLAVRSGYAAAELAGGNDRYGDKALHRDFIDRFAGGGDGVAR
jgi:hypothetical protein